MFKRRDIPPVLLLLLLIILVMLTLSQILVVHNGRYGRNVHNMRKLQLELREMDVNLHTLMMKNVPSIELNRRQLQNEINSQRFAEIISQAANKDLTKESLDLPSSRIQYGINVPGLTTSVNRSHIDTGNTPFQTEAEIGRAISDSDTYLTLRAISPQSGQHYANESLHLSADTTEIDTETSHNTVLGDNNQTQMDHNVTTGQVPEYQPFPSRLRGATNLQAHIKMTYCPSVPPLLRGNIGVNLANSSRLRWEDVADENPEVEAGGTWAPRQCVARHRVAIIIPYRDREQHLITLLYYLHPVLQRQQLDYRVYVVEQFGKDTFNKARLMNIAFVEALKQYHFQCFVFHDVDLVPEDDRNMYSCPQQPRHMSVAIDEMAYKLAYQELVGGVLNLRTEHFQRVNGYSNLYWGWGAEDDDMAYRIMHVGLKIIRPPEVTARYKMAKHTKRKPSDWRKRAKLLYTGTRRFQFDGLNSLQYKVVHVKSMPLYTHVLVDIGRPPRGF